MKPFNIIITGVGGQGLITLLDLISQATFSEGLDVKTSELHGLSQRGGSVGVHIRLGSKVWSPIVGDRTANLIIALEQQEALNGANFANKETIFLINEYETPTMDSSVSKLEIKQNLRKISKNVIFIPGSEICKKELGNDVVAGIYLLGYALSHNFLPLKKESIQQAIQSNVPEKHQDLNLKALELGISSAIH